MKMKLEKKMKKRKKKKIKMTIAMDPILVVSLEMVSAYVFKLWYSFMNVYVNVFFLV